MEGSLTIARHPRLEARFDAITSQRRALFQAGGIHLERFVNGGRMVADAPEHEARAAEYNALADLHHEVGKRAGLV